MHRLAGSGTVDWLGRLGACSPSPCAMETAAQVLAWRWPHGAALGVVWAHALALPLGVAGVGLPAAECPRVLLVLS